MAEKMGKYCKAYYLKDFRGFSNWQENIENARREKIEKDGEEIEIRRILYEDTILYLQENYVVTDGIFLEKNIIFENITADWVKYCNEVLKFEIPDYAKNDDNGKEENQVENSKKELENTEIEENADEKAAELNV